MAKDTGASGGQQRDLAVGLVFAILGGVISFLIVYFLLQRRRRRRLQRSAAVEGASGRIPPAHLTRLERLALPETGADPDSIRQLRQRRWTVRQGNNGLTLDELDLVAPVRSYALGMKGSLLPEESSSEEEVDGGAGVSAVAERKKAAGRKEQLGKGIPSWGDESDDTCCAVCLEDMNEGDKTRKLRCGHDFHADCIEAWVTKANRCPVCSVEPLEAASIARRRNARSSTRRGIDAAISQQRRRRTRGPNGIYELESDGQVADSLVAENAPAVPVDEAAVSASATVSDGGARDLVMVPQAPEVGDVAELAGVRTQAADVPSPSPGRLVL